MLRTHTYAPSIALPSITTPTMFQKEKPGPTWPPAYIEPTQKVKPSRIRTIVQSDRRALCGTACSG
jgi:hypothetical protein